MRSAEKPEFPPPTGLPKPHSGYLWQPQDTYLKTEQIIANPYQDLRDSRAPQPTEAQLPLVVCRRLSATQLYLTTRQPPMAHSCSLRNLSGVIIVFHTFMIIAKNNKSHQQDKQDSQRPSPLATRCSGKIPRSIPSPPNPKDKILLC